MISQKTYTMDRGLFHEFFILLGKIVHADLVKQAEYLKVENQILRGKLGRCIKVTPSEKRRLIKYGTPLGPDIKRFMSIVSYTTFWRWQNKPVCKRPPRLGRKRTNQDIRDLVVRLAKENNWGYTRILGELRKLHIHSLSRNTVKNILKENGLDPAPKRGEDSWDSFIKRHFETLWACDFFSKTVWTVMGPKTFHVLFFINVHTRKVHIAGMTKNPTTRWVDKAVKTVSFLFEDAEEKLLIRDGDCKFLGKFDEIFKEWNTEVKRIPYKSPNLNPYAEGWVGTMKRECLDHFFVFGESHLKYLIEEFVRFYNTERPHTGKNNEPLDGIPSKPHGKIRCDSKLGGILRHYYRM